ncbi:MAG: hypothetical protein JWO40_889 [Candidatus Doudnabacteria bacterium]|nr:hypothetical protein [Candidatus Doudnabacteria bacterium]
MRLILYSRQKVIPVSALFYAIIQAYKDRMIIKQKPQFKRVFINLLVLATIFGYGLRADAFLGGNAGGLAAGTGSENGGIQATSEQLSSSQLATSFDISLTAPIETKDVSGIISYGGCAVGTSISARENDGSAIDESDSANNGTTLKSTTAVGNTGSMKAALTNVKLQNAVDLASGNPQNILTQQAYHLDPNLSQNCIELSVGVLHSQSAVSVKEHPNTYAAQILIVQKAQKIIAYSFAAGRGQAESTTGVVSGGQNFSDQKESVSVGVRLSTGDVALYINKMPAVSFNAFEILRC